MLQFQYFHIYSYTTSGVVAVIADIEAFQPQQQMRPLSHLNLGLNIDRHIRGSSIP